MIVDKNTQKFFKRKTLSPSQKLRDVFQIRENNAMMMQQREDIFCEFSRIFPLLLTLLLLARRELDF